MKSMDSYRKYMIECCESANRTIFSKYPEYMESYISLLENAETASELDKLSEEINYSLDNVEIVIRNKRIEGIVNEDNDRNERIY